MPSARHPGFRMIASAVALLAITGCGKTTEEESEVTAAKIEPIAGTELSQVTLTSDAAKRIDLQMEPVEEDAAGGVQVPYEAVLYDPDGDAWVFARIDGLTFAREPITIERIEDDLVFLSGGPAVGTEVVTLGAAQLYGAEIGVGDE